MLETHISYPTDLGLVHQVVNRLTESASTASNRLTRPFNESANWPKIPSNSSALLSQKFLGRKGYYSTENIAALRKLGVRRVGIAKIGRLKPRERFRQHSRWFLVQDPPTFPLWHGGGHQYAQTVLHAGRYPRERFHRHRTVGRLVDLQLQPLELQLSQTIERTNHTRYQRTNCRQLRSSGTTPKLLF